MSREWAFKHGKTLHQTLVFDHQTLVSALFMLIQQNARNDYLLAHNFITQYIVFTLHSTH